MAYKKLDKVFVLSDSSVNCYGFRLMTSGYQLAQYAANPIGYYMHCREEGILVRWDNLTVSNDQITGTPIINLSNERGEQTCAEIEEGFLNAASMGDIVVIEYSTDPAMMLPGQTGPTITKWTNKECSLVDIPGNENALVRLYDQHDNVINLTDLTGGNLNSLSTTGYMKKITLALTAGLLANLKWTGVGEPTEAEVGTAIQNLADKAAKYDALEVETTALKAKVNEQSTKIVELNNAKLSAAITATLEKATADGKITVALRDKLAKDYATNPEGLADLVAAMPKYQSIVGKIGETTAENLAWASWDDYEKNDVTGKKLAALKANNPTEYQRLYDAKFKKD